MITTKTASELRVGMTVLLSGRSPQKVTGIAEQFSLTYGSSYKVWLEFGTIIDWVSPGFKFKVEIPDAEPVESKEAIAVNFLLPSGLDQMWLDALFMALRQGDQP